MLTNASKRLLTKFAFFGSIAIVLMVAMPSMSDWHSYGFSTFVIVWGMIVYVLSAELKRSFDV